MPETFSNAAASTLASSIGAGDSSLTVASATGFPFTGTFRVRIDNELMIVSGNSSPYSCPFAQVFFLQNHLEVTPKR